MLDQILVGLLNVFNFHVFLALVIGVAVGMVIGSLPGLSVTMGVALLLPFTFGMSPEAGMLLLIGVYCAGTYGGSISAILLNTPGTAASAATSLDGYALSRQGKAGSALNMSIYASVIGGLISGVALLFVAPQIARFALSFGPPEFFALAIFGLSIIAGVSGNALGKGLIMACLGMLIATVGIDSVDGFPRFTFGFDSLTSGFELVPVLIGLFAISEIFNQLERRAKSISGMNKVKNEKFGLKELKPFRKTIVKSSFIGVIVGAIPGTGGAIASFLSYNEARRSSKNPSEFGKGSLDGVAASEAGNNGVTGATLIPMLTLGIPGDVVTAVLLGSLLIQGLRPGPDLFVNYGPIVYTVMIGFLVVNVVMFFVAKSSIKYFAKLSVIPNTILLPIVLGLCLIGSFAVNNSFYSVFVAIAFGLIGYIFTKFKYPIAPMLIAMILGPMAENALRQSLIISQGSYKIFFQSPIAITFIILTILSMALPFITSKLKKKPEVDHVIEARKIGG